MRLLVVEDDAELAQLLGRGLRNAGYATDVCGSYAEAIDALLVTDYDVACLDLGLPDGDGINLCRHLSNDDTLLRPRRVLLLTGRDAVADRVVGLDAGADDYLVKPFDFAELLARIRALTRRESRHGPLLMVGNLTIDESAGCVWRDGELLQLTSREFALLRYFAHHAGEMLSAEHLLEHVWDMHADPMTTTVRVILSRLRRKLGEPPMISTVIGQGYRLEEAG